MNLTAISGLYLYLLARGQMTTIIQWHGSKSLNPLDCVPEYISLSSFQGNPLIQGTPFKTIHGIPLF